MPAWTRQTWAQEQLGRCMKKVREAPSGTRNDELFRQAATMADYIDDGSIGEANVRSCLEAAAMDAGLGGTEVGRTLDSALGRGDGGKAWYPANSGNGPRPEVKVPARRLRLVPTKVDTKVPTVEMAPSTDVRVTWYASITEVKGEVSRWSWDEIAMAVESPSMADPERLPLWAVHELEGDSRAKIPDGLGSDGRERFRSPAVLAVHALMLDYDDDAGFTLENVRKWWGEVQHVAHTTRHHMQAKDKKPAIPRGRVLLALSRSITADELERLAGWVLALGRGVPAATELKTAARAYFVPVWTEGYWHETNRCGRALDVDAALMALEQEEVAAAPDVDVSGMLERNEDGVILRTPTNLDTILEHDHRWADKVVRCEFSGKVLVDGAALADETETEIALKIGQVYGLHYPEERVHKSVVAVAARHPWHPVREYLEGLTWDGKKRLDGWLHRLVGCVDGEDQLTDRMGRLFMVSAVARIFEPGCKVDTVLIVQGLQGEGKSSAFRVLFGDAWFSDTGLDIRSKDAFQGLRGKWCVEWGELDSLRRSEATAVKAFLTSQVDSYRPSYGRNTVDVPRQCVFVGTTNEATFLNDSTGSRRFWVVESRNGVDLARIAAERDQLWAETAAAYRAKEPWWLTREEDQRREAAAARWQHCDAWDEVVSQWLAQHQATPCTAADVLVHALRREVGEVSRADEMRVAAILQKRGWTKKRLAVGNERAWRWVGPGRLA
jgi:predicted P-loop ATPase